MIQLKINNYSHNNNIPFQGAKYPRKQYVKIFEEPQKVQEMYLKNGISQTARDFGVCINSMRNFLKKHNLFVKDRITGRNQPSLENKTGINIQKICEDIIAGKQQGDMAKQYGVSKTTIINYMKAHKAEFDYMEFKRGVRQDMIKQCKDAAEVSDKFNICLPYATTLRNSSIKKSIPEQKREARLAIAIPLHEQGKSASYIAKQVGVTKSTILKDLQFHRENLKK